MDIVYCIRFLHSSEVKIGYSNVNSIDSRFIRLRGKYGAFEVVFMLMTEYSMGIHASKKNPVEAWFHRRFDSSRVGGRNHHRQWQPERFNLTYVELIAGVAKARESFNFIECWY